MKAENLSVDSVTEAPAFQAKAEWSPQGWIVKGSFQDFTPDTILVQPMCSTDGQTYDDCGQEWSLQWLSSEDENELARLQNQRCLYDSEEPFKSYLSKELDRFFIKLRIVRENGEVYETQTAVIERSEQQTVPAEMHMEALFAPCMLVREGRPPAMQYFGRYQITVREDASLEEIAALLPDTLPVQVQIYAGDDYIGNDIVDCSVRWKPLCLSQLTAGESVTVPDAAEEICVPENTVLTTQTGTCKTDQPIALDQYGVMTDEVRLVLNIIANDGQPEGVLAEENDGLEISFQLKPTGARAIRAYALTEDSSTWTELVELSLPDIFHGQLSTANSGYTMVLGKEQEPYLSYRKAREAGEEAAPFFLGLKIEGGVYDGRQLVLAWPDTYELPPDLPEVGGSGGNEGNAGSDDRNDSTEGGQRPGISQEDPEKTTISEPAGLNRNQTDRQQPDEPEANLEESSDLAERDAGQQSAEELSELSRAERRQVSDNKEPAQTPTRAANHASDIESAEPSKGKEGKASAEELLASEQESVEQMEAPAAVPAEGDSLNGTGKDDGGKGGEANRENAATALTMAALLILLVGAAVASRSGAVRRRSRR